jgi:hypothetical protein
MKMISLMTILMIIGFVVMANAECAWVLWKETDTSGNPVGKFFGRL